MAVVAAYSFVLSWLLAKAIDRTVGFRVAEEVEVAGIDQAEHAESAYDFSAVGAGLARALPGLVGAAAAARSAERPAAGKAAAEPSAEPAATAAGKAADTTTAEPTEKTEVDAR